MQHHRRRNQVVLTDAGAGAAPGVHRARPVATQREVDDDMVLGEVPVEIAARIREERGRGPLHPRALVSLLVAAVGVREGDAPSCR